MRFVIFIIVLIAITGCKKEDDPYNSDKGVYIYELPAHFPIPDIPSDNQLTTERIELGKMLFQDKRLSVDNTISCSSCHLPDKAMADTGSLSYGVEGRTGIRNAPSLANVAYHPYYFWDGGVPTLELQVLAPIADHNEMDFNAKEVVDKLKNDPVYQSMAKEAYNRSFDAFVLTRAIAAYERTLISSNSKYDDYLQGNYSLNAQEQLGMNLFYSDSLACADCHSGFNFTNYTFQNIGLYTSYADSGRARITMLPEDAGKFKVPSLRNLSYTAPYMHDGTMNTLEEVIVHFESGGHSHPNKSNLMMGFSLTQNQREALISFLRTLDDSVFIDENQ